MKNIMLNHTNLAKILICLSVVLPTFANLKATYIISVSLAYNI